MLRFSTAFPEWNVSGEGLLGSNGKLALPVKFDVGPRHAVASTNLSRLVIGVKDPERRTRGAHNQQRSSYNFASEISPPPQPIISVLILNVISVQLVSESLWRNSDVFIFRGSAPSPPLAFSLPRTVVAETNAIKLSLQGWGMWSCLKMHQESRRRRRRGFINSPQASAEQSCRKAPLGEPKHSLTLSLSLWCNFPFSESAPWESSSVAGLIGQIRTQYQTNPAALCLQGAAQFQLSASGPEGS